MPDVRTAIRIADALETTVEALFRESRNDTSVAQNEQMCNTEDMEGDESGAKS